MYLSGVIFVEVIILMVTVLNNASEVEVNYMGNQGRQGGFSNNYPQGWKNNQNQNFGWKQDYNSSNKQGPFQQQHQSNSPSIPDRMNKVEDVLSKIVSTQENSMATIRSMETQIGQLAKQMSQLTQTVEGKIGQFSANTTTNPKEQCNNITTEGDEKTREENGEMVKVEKEKEKNKEEGENCEIVEIAKEISHRNIKKEKEGLFSDNLLPKNYFAGWPEKKTYFDEVRRKICCFKNKYGEKEAGSSFSKICQRNSGI